MCYQVVDDVLDLTTTDDHLGKPAGQDLLEGVYTLPVIYAVSSSDGLRAMLGSPLDPEKLERARLLATSNGAVDAAIAVARDHAAKAGEALSGAVGLEPAVVAQMCRLVDDLVDRTS